METNTSSTPAVFGSNGSPGKAVGRKHRSQGKIAQMSKEQRARLHQYLRENLIYSEIQARLKAEFGLSIASSTLSEYYQRHAFEFMITGAPEGNAGEVNEARFTLVLHLEIRPGIISAEVAGG